MRGQMEGRGGKITYSPLDFFQHSLSEKNQERNDHKNKYRYLGITLQRCLALIFHLQNGTWLKQSGNKSTLTTVRAPYPQLLPFVPLFIQERRLRTSLSVVRQVPGSCSPLPLFQLYTLITRGLWGRQDHRAEVNRTVPAAQFTCTGANRHIGSIHGIVSC